MTSPAHQPREFRDLVPNSIVAALNHPFKTQNSNPCRCICISQTAGGSGCRYLMVRMRLTSRVFDMISLWSSRHILVDAAFYEQIGGHLDDLDLMQVEQMMHLAAGGWLRLKRRAGISCRTMCLASSGSDSQSSMQSNRCYSLTARSGHLVWQVPESRCHFRVIDQFDRRVEYRMET
jgi:hypothetical protein